MTIAEACKQIKGFCITSTQRQNALDTNHDYFYQVQCQLYCTQCAWCNFVIRTNKELYIGKIFEMKHGGRNSFLTLGCFTFKLFYQNLNAQDTTVVAYVNLNLHQKTSINTSVSLFYLPPMYIHIIRMYLPCKIHHVQHCAIQAARDRKMTINLSCMC